MVCPVVRHCRLDSSTLRERGSGKQAHKMAEKRLMLSRKDFMRSLEYRLSLHHQF
jgi:hypothetical protein